jgi:four helix bundle protein
LIAESFGDIMTHDDSTIFALIYDRMALCWAESFRRTLTMSRHLLPFQTLDAYIVAKEIARIVHVAKISDAELRDQATRASKSTFLCLCEGLPNEGVALRRKYFNEANNSLHETLGAMDLAATIGAARKQDASAVQELGVRLKQMLRALVR